MTKIKLAATIMLGRDRKGELEVLLLRRNKALAFAGGLWVFPGGKIEPAELEQTNDELSAAQLAAVRETKEETNLDVVKDQLVFFRHWTTPAIEPKRYATYFFYTSTTDREVEVQIDDSEIKDHLWLTPKQALEMFGQAKLAMLPPTLMSLQLISTCKTTEDVHHLLRNEAPIFILPILEMKGTTMLCIYEGDEKHPATSNPTEGARHRLIMDMKTGKFLFEHENCEDFPPVNGGMHK